MRNAFIGGLASLLLGLGSCSKNSDTVVPLNSRTYTDADLFFKNFPGEGLPNTEHIYKFQIDGAKHCLVHIQQPNYIDPPISMAEAKSNPFKLNAATDEVLRHYPYSPVPTSSGIDKYREVFRYGLDENCSVQRDIFTQLSFLGSHGIMNVRSEGLLADVKPQDCYPTLMFRNHFAVRDGFAIQEEVVDPNRYFMLGGRYLAFGMNASGLGKLGDKSIFYEAARKSP